jgi:hypothetical protein
MFLAAGWLMGQDTKPADTTTPATGKAKGSLPPYFSKLGLTDEQRQKVVKIHASYKGKIDSLKEQISQLSNEERAELFKVLSDTQRTRYRELRAREPESTKEGASTPEKAEKKEEKKTDKSDK